LTKPTKAFVLWLTGLSGAGKTTLAKKVFEYIEKKGLDVEKLDGDVLRGHFPSTGFSKTERDEHIKRVGFMASILEKHGVIVIASFISPYSQARRFIRDMCSDFVEVYVRAPLDVCEDRDVKGLYSKARAGEIKNFTGIDDPYEEPQNPELTIDTDKQTLDESVLAITNFIDKVYLRGT
jgi:adenylylsulfate kinase